MGGAGDPTSSFNREGNGGNMRIGRVDSSEIAINRDGEKPVMLLQVEITDPDDLQTVEFIQAAGIDFNPAPDTTVIVSELGAAWKIAIGADDGIEPETAAGEFQFYSSAGGAKKAKIHLFADGKIRIENDAGGYIEMSSGGDVDINGNFTVDL